MTDYGGLLHKLNVAEVKYIVVGGLAAMAHGSARFTYDVDVVYERSDENIQKIAEAMADINPYLRNAPPGLPFHFDPPTIKAGLNFTLTTTLGSIDFLGEVAGGGTYEQILPHTVTRELFHKHCLCIDLPRLIILKQAAGRSKDLEAVAELEALWEEIHFPEQARELYPDSPHHRDLSKPDNKDVEPPQ